jgi:hypothetical protein
MWDSGREWKAFAIAPLIAPVVVGIQFGFAGAPNSVVVFIAPLVLVMAYAGTVVFGRPLYSLLRALKLTAFWLAPIAGIFVGFVVVYIFFLVINIKGTGVSRRLCDTVLRLAQRSGHCCGGLGARI